MNATIKEAKAEFDRAKDGIARALAATPDDKINWSPSATARTPLQLVYHAGHGTAGMVGFFSGEMGEGGFDPAAIDDMCRAAEAGATSREAALEQLEKGAATYHAWVDGLTEEQFARPFQTPMGERSMADVITFPADHIRGHTAQLNYIQTVYGDRGWHM